MTMNNSLLNKKVAILAADGFEQAELEGPLKALKTAGAAVDIVSLEAGSIQGMEHTEKGKKFPEAVKFVIAFGEAGKPIAAICHGPWLLVEANLVRGRRLTSWPAIQTDLRNAGGEWVDEEVVVDNGMVTSRKPADIPAFNRKMIEEIAEGRHTPVAAPTW